jgi:excinuclease ABC subunit A
LDNKNQNDIGRFIEDPNYINVYGAKVHNLKNIDVSIPRNSLVVITGLSGSGKSSLAFDTVYAEGQRRYMETMSAYARQFLGNMERPDVDKITGLSPVISIEQKTTNKNPRSTVGTITEIYDFLRLLFARASIAYSYETGEAMVRYTDEQIIKIIIEKFNTKRTAILAPLVKGRKGHYKELFEQIRKKGFLNVRIDGKMQEIVHGLKLDRYKIHDIEVVVDRIVIEEDGIKRLKESVQTAMKIGKGIIMILDSDNNAVRYFSRMLMCPTTGISYKEPAPHSFSFNSPQGACHKCNGLGKIGELDINKLIPNSKLSIRKGALAPLGPFKSSLIFWQLEAIAAKYQFTLNTPVEEIPDEALNVILYGSDESFKMPSIPGGLSNYFLSFDGILNYINQQVDSDDNGKRNGNSYIREIVCPECNGARLNKEALHFRMADMNISQLANMDLVSLSDWLNNIEVKLNTKQLAIAKEVLKEIRTRLGFLLNVGLDYLSLNRPSRTLAGGENQRIRLATQIGSQLVNVLYILDEPSIGLHQRDNVRLIKSLRTLRDAGNSVIVVEHDKEMITSADYVIDMGPKAGRHGGEIVAHGTPKDIEKGCSFTALYLSGKKEISVPEVRRKGNGKHIKIKGATGNNLKNLTVDIPLGMMVCVTGVSGSGKSSLINETLHPVLSRHFYNSIADPLPFVKIDGIENIDKVIEVDQSPIGRTPRSNPVTYTGIFSDIRKLFEQTPESKILGYSAGRFSFNVKGGRCETCRGAGVQTIEMNFLPDVYVVCKDCGGKRYNHETLEIKYKGESISDVLNMTINQAADFFVNIPFISRKLETLKQVGLSYITLGQPSTTLSGGESQRVKLSAELSKKDTGKTLYILDEPTTGLHFEDIRVLINVLNRLVDKGNTVVIIEHNLDVIKVADYIIDLGPEGGARGGEIVCTGTPEKIVKSGIGYTAQFLKKELKIKS